jgi:hypothetical protein
MQPKGSFHSLDKRNMPILILLVINLIIGVITFRSYGESWDEASLRNYADQSLTAYRKWINPSFTPIFGNGDLVYYGPAFVMGVDLFARLIKIIAPSIITTDIWHLAYFFSFLAAVLFMYFLGRRWMSQWAAFGMTILFSSQPLLWGHAYINPKDIPFMSFFLVSIVAGLWMCDRVATALPKRIRGDRSIKSLMHMSIYNWQMASRRSKRVALIIGTVWLLSILFLVLGERGVNSIIAATVRSAYFADPQSMLGRMFANIAHQAYATPLSSYIVKAQTLFGIIRRDYILIGIIAIVWLFRSALPWPIHFPIKIEILSFVRLLGLSFLQPPVIIAGIILGLTTSLRVLGPLAGLIVAIYSLWANGKKMLPFVLAYAMIAIVTMYLTWPFLWSAPFSNFLESIKTMSAFPWHGIVLFNGSYYSPDNLPRSYLPTLLSIQFTEPVIVMFAIGSIIAAYGILQRKNIDFIGITLIWFFIPLGSFIVTRPPIYDNFRQLLFIVPPIFLFCGIALEAIFRSARKWLIKSLIIILLISPGIYAINNLHPFEYIYYNSFVGGVGGAFRKFETDYWLTSYREAAEFLNREAHENAKVIVWMNSQLVKTYARPDLIIEQNGKNTYELTGGYNYAILSPRYGNDDIYPDEGPIFSVSRGNAILAVVKRLSPLSSP